MTSNEMLWSYCAFHFLCGLIWLIVAEKSSFPPSDEDYIIAGLLPWLALCVWLSLPKETE